ncbi:hypothetical protein [Kaarinaea lacus]
MSVAYDAVSTGSDTNNTVSATHTASGSNRIAVALVAGVRNNDTAWNWDSVTYDSVSMTQQADISLKPTGGRYINLEIWTLLSPNTTASASVDASTSVTLLSSSIAVITFTGVQGVSASATDSAATGTAASVDVGTNNANSWLVGAVAAFEQSGATGTPGASVTERWDFEVEGGFSVDDHNNMGGHLTCTTTGTYTFDYTIPTSNDWLAAAIEITEIPTPGGGDLIGASEEILSYGVRLA